MPMRGWSPKQGQPLPPACVVSIWYSVQRLVGSPLVLTAMSRWDEELSRAMKRISANQVFVAVSYWQRGSLVNSCAPSLKRSLTLNGPSTGVPFVRWPRYAELTGSTTKPLPSQSPWSGGSNVALKLVSWLSRLLTPLKLACTVDVDLPEVPAAPGARSADAAAAPEEWMKRAPRARVLAVPAGTLLWVAAW